MGAGPAGLAPLFAAASGGRLPELLKVGVTILERSQIVGAGDLGRYAITSDSSAKALLDVVVRSREPQLSALRSHPLTLAVAAHGKGSVPLALVAKFLHLAGSAICKAVIASERGVLLKGATVRWTQQTRSGRWRTCFADAQGGLHTVESANVILATGACQPISRLTSERVAGVPLLPTFKGKLMQSGEVLTSAGLAAVSERLREKHNPTVSIVGGSTSAAAVAHALLTRLPTVSFGEGGVTMLHRRPIRIFYDTASEAIADGYHDFSSDDVCAVTGRVYRLSGFRLQSRELMMSALRVGGRSAEPRLRLLQLSPERNEAVQAQMRSSDLIVAALGYRPRLLPVFDAAMAPVPLLSPTADRWASVGNDCRVVCADTQALPGLFALGLAVGPGADRQLGGELGYAGQVNSLWLWQHTLGLRIVDQIVGCVHEERSAAVPLRSDPWTAASVRLASVQTSELAGAA